MIQKIIQPIQKFVNVESLSGILLFGATIIALIWANSPFASVYTEFWQQKIGFKFADFSLIKPLILWVNDGLMAVFFFLIGLEIKREIMIGELNSFQKAAFPMVAALGGMILPMSLYLIFNKNPETITGWGIPMATDIAFSLAILKLLGNRVPLSLKIFLTAFAIVDDLGAVIVIALFYSGQINIALIVVAVAIVGLMFVLTKYQWYSKYLYFVLGVTVWFLFLKSGIHPTIAGVLLAFTIPIQRKFDEVQFAAKLKELSSDFQQLEDDEPTILSDDQIAVIDELQDWTEKAQSPLQQLEHGLHNWVAYLVMPVFALANAGVTISTETQFDYSLILTIIVALIAGNLIGITAFITIGLKLNGLKMPDGMSYSQLIGISLLAGVGFTMSIFVANLAFDNQALLDSAKIGVLIASVLAGSLGYIVLRLVLPKKHID